MKRGRNIGWKTAFIVDGQESISRTGPRRASAHGSTGNANATLIRRVIPRELEVMASMGRTSDDGSGVERSGQGHQSNLSEYCKSNKQKQGQVTASRSLIFF